MLIVNDYTCSFDFTDSCYDSRVELELCKVIIIIGIL